MLFNCGAGEDTWESLGQQGEDIKPVSPKGNQSWIFFGRIDAKAEAPILWPFMWRMDFLEKTMMLGKIEGRRGSGWQRMRWLDSITDSMNMNLSKQWRTGEPGVLWSMGSQRARQDLVTEPQQLAPYLILTTFLLKKNAHWLKMNFISQHCSFLSLPCS